VEGDYLSNENNLANKVEYLRMKLNSMISLTMNLTHPEIVELSQELDNALNKYHDLTICRAG